MEIKIFCLKNYQNWDRENLNFIFENEIPENLSQKRQTEIYWSRSFIRKIAIKDFGAELKDLKIIKNKWGKPSFEKTPNIHFNISHAGDCICVVVLDEPIGIDIEKINRKILNQNKIEKKLFSPEESESEKDFNFIWTRKEALAKLLGKSVLSDEIKINTLNKKINLNNKKIYIKTLIKEEFYISLAKYSDFKKVVIEVV